jgi:hypothetical protein
VEQRLDLQIRRMVFSLGLGVPVGCEISEVREIVRVAYVVVLRSGLEKEAFRFDVC